MSMNGLAGVVIIYHPDHQWQDRINSYLEHLEHLFIIDNSESNTPHNFHDLEKITYRHDGSNEGIAVRLNQAARLAADQGFQWLLTMDQDSSFPQGMLTSYLKCCAESKAEPVAMFGISFTASAKEVQDCSAEFTRLLITSGSLLNLSLFEKVGGFDENLFIDNVDFDYCFAAGKKGFQTILFNHILLEHQIGTASFHRSLKTGSKTQRILHSPIRLYYQTRNYLYLRRKYQGLYAKEFAHIRKDLLNRIKNNLLYGSERFSVARFIVNGYQDYRSNKMGKKRTS